MLRGRAALQVVAAAAASERVPDMNKRNLMNLLLLGAIGLPTVGLLGPYAYFFVPPG
jgi:cytochrome b6-f complex iron-sulfur subunit